MTRKSHKQQAGATLVVTLVFLVLLSIFAINAFNGSNTNLKIVGNAQVRQEAIAAAQAAIEQTISSTLFVEEPITVANSPVNIKVDGTDSGQYTVTMAKPTCYRYRNIRNSELDPTNDDDRACMTSSNAGNAGSPIGSLQWLGDNSLCAHTEWDLRATVTDTRTGAAVAVQQGVGVRVLEGNAADNCK